MLIHRAGALKGREAVMEAWKDDEERPMFRDRADAGTVLAGQLERYRSEQTLVLGIPRGGVVVAAAVARALGASLDVIVTRKLGAPISAELAIGAVTANGGRFLDQAMLGQLDVSDAYLEAVTKVQRAEAARQERAFRGDRPPPAIEGATVIIVDDGLATGSTMRAAVRSVRQQRPARIVVAVPVGSTQACAGLRSEADEVVCPHEVPDFGAVGWYYQEFGQTSDDEVQELLDRVHAGAVAGPPAGR
jgi:putative phosphoribosyl transferase